MLIFHDFELLSKVIWIIFRHGGTFHYYFLRKINVGFGCVESFPVNDAVAGISNNSWHGKAVANGVDESSELVIDIRHIEDIPGAHCPDLGFGSFSGG